MIFITGGAFQGKTGFVTDKIGIPADKIINGAECDINDASDCVCIFGFHDLIKRIISQNGDAVGFTTGLCEKNRDIVIIMDEIGCGVIPIEKSERVWRENVGKCGCIIAEHSDAVIRMVCGIPTFLKGKLP